MNRLKKAIFALILAFCVAGVGFTPAAVKAATVGATTTKNGSTVAATGEDVVKNAFAMTNYVYWYGGSGEKCTTTLLNRLARLYPSVYTATYKAKCQIDIKNGKYCIDCSGFVCKASGLPHYSTYQMMTNTHFRQVNKSDIKNGMIVWRPTHCGIYYNGDVITTVNGEYIIEARGIDYDITTTRKYKASEWTRVYKVDGIDYNSIEKLDDEYDYAARMVIQGKYGNGAERKKKLEAAGYDYSRVQALVNQILRGY